MLSYGSLTCECTIWCLTEAQELCGFSRKRKETTEREAGTERRPTISHCSTWAPMIAQESPACPLCPHGPEQLCANVALQPCRALDYHDRNSQTLTVQVSRWNTSQLQGVCEEHGVGGQSLPYIRVLESILSWFLSTGWSFLKGQWLQKCFL